jgi:cysteine synthase A
VSHLVFVESNTTGTGRLAVERLLAAGDRVTFLTRSREKYPFLAILAAAAPGFSVIDAETNDAAALTARIAALHRTPAVGATGATGAVDAVLTFSDFYVDIVAVVAERLGFRYLGPAPARICRSKLLTRSTLRAAGLPVPEFGPAASVDEALLLARRLGFPCVVKPPSDSSSFGVRVVAGEAELAAHVRGLAAMTTNVRGQRLDGTVVVEGYLAGEEYSVETVTLPGGALHVVGVTDKYLSAPPHCVELGHDFPSALPPPRRAAVAAAAAEALAAVGFDFGPAHTEVRWTAGGPVVVEINPRLAGGMIPELVRHATGIDLLAVLLDLLLGRPARLVPERDETAGIRFLTAGEAGRLRAVHGLDEARRLPAVREAVVYRPEGAVVQPAENAYHRLGHVLAAGADRARVIADLERARALVRVEVVEAAPAGAAAAGALR